MDKITVAFIIVNYNTSSLLRQCIDSIQKYTPVSYKIIVVDNNSTDGSPSMVKNAYPYVHLIANKHNSGFPKAVNQGLQAVKANYYFILNSDTQLLKNTVANLAQYMAKYPYTGIAAPAQQSQTGQPILSVYQYPTLRREWTRNLFFGDILRYRIRGTTLAQRFTEPQSVEWVMGAALFVRSECIRDIGYMDEEIFMYGEELDWCYRAAQHGWRIGFVPDALIIHHKSASADKALNARRYPLVAWSNYYFWAKHHGWITLILFVLAQITGSVIRMSIAAGLCVLGKRVYCSESKEHYLTILMSLKPQTYKDIWHKLKS